jgi:hypothetical protein
MIEDKIYKKENKETRTMNKIQIHSKNSRENKTSELALKIFFSLSLLFLFSFPDSVRAYEWDKKALEESGNMSFPKQAASAPFGQLQKKGYVFGMKMNFEVNTIWSAPKKTLNSEQLINNLIGEEYFSGMNNISNELPLETEMSLGAKPAKLVEIRF